MKRFRVARFVSARGQLSSNMKGGGLEQGQNTLTWNHYQYTKRLDRSHPLIFQPSLREISRVLRGFSGFLAFQCS